MADIDIDRRIAALRAEREREVAMMHFRRAKLIDKELAALVAEQEQARRLDAPDVLRVADE